MMEEDPRRLLEALIHDRGEDYASLSRMIGRNPAYIQQYIKRGSPRRLAEEDRALLARYFGIAESRLGGRDRPVLRVAAAESGIGRQAAEIILIPRLDVRASAGQGAEASGEAPLGRIGFDAAFLRELAGGGPAGLSMIRVTGDSMMPALSDGDEILVDRGDGPDRLRDGIYVLRMDESLLVKRIALNPARGGITVRSDNPAYPIWPDCDPATIDVIGRVIWAGRRVG